MDQTHIKFTTTLDQERMTQEGRKRHWRICNSRGKGKGVDVTKDFKMGEEVWSENPEFVFNDSEPKTILTMVSEADKKKSNYFYSLSHNETATRLKEWEKLVPDITVAKGKILDITDDRSALRLAKFYHNRVDIPDHSGKTNGHVIGRFCSRLNHSCVPNCWMSWNEATKVLSVHAMRDIRFGEELFIFYRMEELFFKKREARMQELQQKYNFVCDCEACDLDKGGGAAKRREDIASLMENITSTTDSKTVLSTYEKIEGLMDWEEDGWEKGKIHLKLAEAYKKAGSSFHEVAMGQHIIVEMVAKTNFGPDSKELQDVQEKIEQLKQTQEEWKLRKLLLGD